MTDLGVNDLRYEPDEVLPPGETLAEVLEEAGMTQAELAQRTGLSTKHINQIIKGLAPITTETALLFERATGVRARIWSNLEIAYREHLSRREEEKTLLADVAWLDELPVKELIKRGFVDNVVEPVERVRSVCRFFGVANRHAWETLWHKPTHYRTSQAFNSDPGAVAAWLRIGEILAARITCRPFDHARLKALLPEVRDLTCEPEPSLWLPSLVSRCAEVGVAVVVVREVKGARINGAARWLTPDKALIQLSLRHRWNDIFWFTFFHEVAHLLLHSKKETFINEADGHSGVEQEADGFAAQALIPRRYEARLFGLNTEDEVRRFAAEIGVAPGIVVGRLQHVGRWSHSRGRGLQQRLDPDTIEALQVDAGRQSNVSPF